MRIRTIKPEFYKHESLYDLEEETGMPIRLAFTGLWGSSDREGRFKWKPRRLKAEILPYDDLDFSRVLDAFATRGLVVKYTLNGEDFGYIPSFLKHQVINNRETASTLPSPDECEVLTREARVDHASCARTSGREGKGKEGNRKGRDLDKSKGATKAAQTRTFNLEFKEMWKYLSSLPNNKNFDSAQKQYAACRRAGFSEEDIKSYYWECYCKNASDKKYIKQFKTAVTIGNLKAWKETDVAEMVLPEEEKKDAWDSFLDKLDNLPEEYFGDESE